MFATEAFSVRSGGLAMHDAQTQMQVHLEAFFALGARFPFWSAVLAPHTSAGLGADYFGTTTRANVLMPHLHNLLIVDAKSVPASTPVIDSAGAHLAVDGRLAERTRIHE